MHKKNTVEETVSYVNTQKTNRSNIIALVIWRSGVCMYMVLCDECGQPDIRRNLFLCAC